MLRSLFDVHPQLYKQNRPAPIKENPETGFFREYSFTAQRLDKNPVSFSECINLDRT
jgi:hypothetical protein